MGDILLCVVNLLLLPSEQVCQLARDHVVAIVVPSWLFNGRKRAVVDWIPLCGPDGWREKDAVTGLVSVVEQVAGCCDNHWRRRRSCGNLSFKVAFGCDAARLGWRFVAVILHPLHGGLLAAAAVRNGQVPWLGAQGLFRVPPRLLPMAPPLRGRVIWCIFICTNS
jgi:hypothetical protein